MENQFYEQFVGRFIYFARLRFYRICQLLIDNQIQSNPFINLSIFSFFSFKTPSDCLSGLFQGEIDSPENPTDTNPTQPGVGHHLLCRQLPLSPGDSCSTEEIDYKGIHHDNIEQKISIRPSNYCDIPTDWGQICHLFHMRKGL